MSSKFRVTVNLSEAEHRELVALSQSTGISKALLGRQAIARLLEQYKNQELQVPLLQIVRDRAVNQ